MLNKRKILKSSAGMSHWLIVVILAVVMLVGSTAFLRTWYHHNLSAVSSSDSVHYFTVNQGSGVHQIALNLQKTGLIRSSNAFETYVTSNDYRGKLQAGTYSLSPSMSVQTIVDKMVKGDVARNLLTILPGKRLDQIKQAFSKAGYTQKELEVAFNPVTYKDIPMIANLPKGSSLEGYIYPDSFQRQSDTPAQNIIRQSLDEMQSHLTSNIVKGFEIQGLSLHEGVTLASIVAQESGDQAYQPKVAQVFLSRLKQDMALQSDVTANYAADTIGVARSVRVDSPYNTYAHKGLPPGPISNVITSALKAVAHPATTTYLYFITGDNGKMYFSYTSDEHQQLIQKYCKQACYQQ